MSNGSHIHVFGHKIWIEILVMRNLELVMGESSLWSFTLTILDGMSKDHMKDYGKVSFWIYVLFEVFLSNNVITFFFIQIWIELNQMQIELYFQIYIELNWNCMQCHSIISFERNLVFTKSNHFFHHFIVASSVQ